VSVTSGRLLVTSPRTRRLLQFDADRQELCRVSLPSNILARCAAESGRGGSFVVSCSDTELDLDVVAEVAESGRVLRRFGGCGLPSLRWPNHLAVVDSSRGTIVLLADCYSGRVLQLDARLALRRVIVDELRLSGSSLRGLCYVEQSGHLLVALSNSVAVFDLLRSSSGV